MSASSTSDSGRKRDSLRSTSKKSKKKAEQERTAGNSGLHSISEGTKELDTDSDGNPRTRDVNDEDSGDDGSTQQEVTMSDMMSYMQDMHVSLTDTISAISKRVDNLEVTRNLSNTGAFSTPRPKRKKGDKHKKERRTSMSLMDSVVRSSAKMNWRTIQKDNEDFADKKKDNSPDFDPDPDESDDENSSNDSSSSKSNSDIDNDDAYDILNDSSTNGKFKSPLGHLFKNLDASQKSASRTVVNVTRVEKECNVRINDFALNNVCRAMKSIIEFQERENTEVKMTKVLSTSCKKHLRIKYNVLTGDLLDMNMSTLFSIIAKETRVHSRVQFYSELKKALSHTQLMEWEKVNSNNHETFYFQQLNLAEDFMLVLRIMLQENKHECPKVNDKENGLIRLFRSFHSYEYWKYIWCGMTQHYSRMQDFIDEYLDKAMQQYQLSQALKEIPYKQSTKATDKEKAYYDKKRDISRSFNSRNNNANSKFVNNHNRLHNINGNSSSDDSVDDTWHNANPVVSDKQTSEHSDDCDSGEDSISIASNDTKEDIDKELTEDQNLAAFNDHNKPKLDRKELACLRKLLSGKCDNLDCPYGHRRDILVKGATEMKAKCNAFLSSQGTSNSENNKPPYKILTKDKYSKA